MKSSTLSLDFPQKVATLGCRIERENDIKFGDVGFEVGKSSNGRSEGGPKEATVESVVRMTTTSLTRSIVEMNIERSAEMSIRLEQWQTQPSLVRLVRWIRNVEQQGL